MKNFEFLEDLIKILIPAAAVMYAMYLVVKSFLSKDFERRLVEMRVKNTELILPIRLQAYERMALFLERISLSNLIVRLSDPNMPALHFQQVLVHEIRHEYNHNLSQQIYMSDQAWKLIKASKEDIINIINVAAQGLAPEARSIELTKKIFDDVLARQEDPTNQALVYLKNEIQKVF